VWRNAVGVEIGVLRTHDTRPDRATGQEPTGTKQSDLAFLEQMLAIERLFELLSCHCEQAFVVDGTASAKQPT